MKIETTLDKLVISEGELQDILRRHILAETGRTVSGTINFQLRNNSAHDKPATAYCNLNPKA